MIGVFVAFAFIILCDIAVIGACEYLKLLHELHEEDIL